MADEYTRSLVDIKEKLTILREKICVINQSVEKTFFGWGGLSDEKAKPEPEGLLQEIDYIIKEAMDYATTLSDRLGTMGVYEK